MLLASNYIFINASHGFTLIDTGHIVSDFSDLKSKISPLLNSEKSETQFKL